MCARRGRHQIYCFTLLASHESVGNICFLCIPKPCEAPLSYALRQLLRESGGAILTIGQGRRACCRRRAVPRNSRTLLRQDFGRGVIAPADLAPTSSSRRAFCLRSSRPRQCRLKRRQKAGQQIATVGPSLGSEDYCASALCCRRLPSARLSCA